MSAAGQGQGIDAARLVWLNGPPLVGKRTLAGLLRDRYSVPVLEAEALGFVLQEGLPARYQPGSMQDVELWLWALWRLGIEMARAYGLAVMTGCLYRPKTVLDVLGQFRETGVDVLHVVLEAEDADLMRRIHGHPCLGVEGKRWALEHRREAVAGLAAVHDGVRLPTTGRRPTDIADDLADSLVAQGWLGGEPAWPGPGDPGVGPAAAHTDEGARQ